MRQDHTMGRLGSIDFIVDGDETKVPFMKSPWDVAVECKNWRQPLPTKEATDFIELIKDCGPCIEIGILLSAGPLDPSTYDIIHVARRESKCTIIPIVEDDLKSLIKNGFYNTVEDCLNRLLFRKKRDSSR